MRRVYPYTSTEEEERRKRSKREERQMDKAIAELPTLDFSDLHTMITWLLENSAFACSRNDIGEQAEQIVSIFREHGIEPELSHDDTDLLRWLRIDTEDEEKFGRWIIDNMLRWLHFFKRFSHYDLERFIKQWREKFGHTVE